MGEFENLVVANVGQPDVVLAIHGEAVRFANQSRAPRRDHFARRAFPCLAYLDFRHLFFKSPRYAVGGQNDTLLLIFN